MDNFLSNPSIIVLLLLILIFLLGRELICWYWKINKIVDVLEKILKRLERQNYNPSIPSVTKIEKSDT